MDNLIFKSTDAAFEYAQKFFGKSKLSLNSSFIGVVKSIDISKEPEVYMVEITCKAGSLLKRKNTMLVAALRHPDLSGEIKRNDLVIFGPSNISLKVPTGYLLHKLEPELDTKTGQFKIAKGTNKFKVFVDDHFNYQNEEQRYEYGEYETIEEAVAACKKIVDRSLNNLLKSCALEELKDKYFSFGEDPFIEGGDFSASAYAEEKIKSLSKVGNSVKPAIDPLEIDLYYKYGGLLPESELLESDTHLYFCQTNRKKLCAGWDKEKKSWEVNIDRSSIEGLSFTTPKRFDQIVFGDEGDEQRHYRKQYLVEYLLQGLNVGEIKTLTKKVDNGARIEFSLEARTWNAMLIGNPVGVEGGMCKYFEQNSQDERILHFALLCANWDVNIELILGEYEEYEQHNFGIKEFGGYYS